jgi:hypothetical protein
MVECLDNQPAIRIIRMSSKITRQALCRDQIGKTLDLDTSGGLQLEQSRKHDHVP